jgi:hypothetical protein
MGELWHAELFIKDLCADSHSLRDFHYKAGRSIVKWDCEYNHYKVGLQRPILNIVDEVSLVRLFQNGDVTWLKKP